MNDKDKLECRKEAYNIFKRIIEKERFETNDELAAYGLDVAVGILDDLLEIEFNA